MSAPLTVRTPSGVVCYRVQFAIPLVGRDVTVTTEAIYSPAEVVSVARQLAARAEEGVAHLLDERGRAVAWVYRSGDATVFQHDPAILAALKETP